MPTTGESTPKKKIISDNMINIEESKKKKYKLEKMLSQIIYTNLERYKAIENDNIKNSKSPPSSPKSKSKDKSKPFFRKKSSSTSLCDIEKVKRYRSEPIVIVNNNKISSEVSPHPFLQRHSYDSIFDNIKEEKKDIEEEEKEFYQCTVDKLTELLIDPDITSQNRSFIQTFITTHQYFMCSTHLLHKLVEFYRNPIHKKESIEIYQIRVINIIKKLLEFKYFDFKNDESFASYLRSFLSSLYSGTVKEKEMAQLLTKTMISNTEIIYCDNDDDIEFNNSFLHTIDISSVKILDWFPQCNPYAFACQNTLKDHQIFIQIKLEDLYFGKFQTSLNVKSFIDRFNNLSSFVATSILKTPNRKQRSSILSKHIQVMDEMRKLQNYHGMMAVYSALNLVPIKRLKKTWKEVPSKIMALYSQAEKLLDNLHGFKEHMKNITPPCIPYLGIITGELSFIEEFPTFMQEDKNDDFKYVNWDKMQMLSSLFTDFLRFQRTQYNLEAEASIVDFDSSWAIEYDDMAALSKDLEAS